jgi:hypothetical protein
MPLKIIIHYLTGETREDKIKVQMTQMEKLCEV